ncbi:MAG: thiamine phosphate synthase, partial [Beijerinckiaceae bacterium]
MSKTKKPETPPAPQIYLVTPRIADAQAFAPLLSKVVAQTAAAAVLLRFAETEERALINAVKILAPLVQDLGAAVLVENNHRVAARGGADGVHVTEGPETLAEVLEAMKPDRIVGVGELPTRHQAMEAAEQPIDYVLFGEEAFEEGSVTEPARAERAQWWAEVFEMPCVICAAN